jgi:hypothetical protein
MSRRFQFSLRTLLGFAALICLLLGGRHLLDTYGSHLEVSDAALGKPIRLKGRLVRVFGPAKCVVTFWGDVDQTDVCEWLHSKEVERSWLCFYEFDYESFCSLDEPGDWTVAAEMMPGEQTDPEDPDGFFVGRYKTFKLGK